MYGNKCKQGVQTVCGEADLPQQKAQAPGIQKNHIKIPFQSNLTGEKLLYQGQYLKQ